MEGCIQIAGAASHRDSLKEKLQIPVVLYYMEDFKVAEIAEKLSLSISNVKSKLMRARRYLKQELEDFII